MLISFDILKVHYAHEPVAIKFWSLYNCFYVEGETTHRINAI